MHRKLKNGFATTFAMSILIALPGYGQAQPGQTQEGKQDNDVAAKFQAGQQRIQQLQAELNRIAAEAENKNPDLGTMQKRLHTLYEAKLKEYGYPSETEIQALQALQNQLQDTEGLAAEERQKLTREFQEKIAALQQSQQQAQQDEAVQQALQQFQQAKAKAMNEIDENASQLQKEFNRLQMELQKLQQHLIQQQQQQQK